MPLSSSQFFSGKIIVNQNLIFYRKSLFSLAYEDFFSLDKYMHDDVLRIRRLNVSYRYAIQLTSSV